MNDIYRNTGARWRRDDGTYIESGAEFIPTDEELIRKAKKLEYISPGPDAAALTLIPRSADVDDYAQGGGWYLIDGEKIQGKAAAAERLHEMENE